MKILNKFAVNCLMMVFLLGITATQAWAFDLGKIIERSVEKSVDRQVRTAENKVTNEIDRTVDKAISSMIPDLSISAKKDDGKQKDLSKGIIIFGFDGCPNCQQAYNFMKKNNIRYQVMNPQEDVKAMRIAKQNGVKTVPVIFVSGDRVEGFTDASYTALFQKHGVMDKQNDR